MPLLIYGADVKNETSRFDIVNFADLMTINLGMSFASGCYQCSFKKFKKYYETGVFRAAGKEIRAMARVQTDFR
jgi:hypothetical protein